MEQIKIKLNGGIMPKRGSEYAAAYDLCVPVDTELHVGRQVIDMRFQIELPKGYAATIQPRSGFSCKGMEVICKMGDYESKERIDADVVRGLIDEDYRGSVGVIVKVAKLNPVVKTYLESGTRIAQMQIVKVPETEFVAVGELDMTKNRGGGYGHTGSK
jgi:deoxyuridine 5'-triphosphate nucleotidohydrolase